MHPVEITFWIVLVGLAILSLIIIGGMISGNF